jgi:DNA polymerase III sliding clamp (beta) subunit (PCNA family)
MAATDRYRLVQAVMTGAHDLLDPSAAIVPWRVCAHVAKSFKAGCLMHAAQAGYGFSDATKTVTVRMIDAAFPRYHGLIPTEHYATHVVVDSGALSTAIKRVSAVLSKQQLIEGMLVVLKPGAVVVGSLTVPAKFEGDAPFETRLAPNFVVDALLAVGPGEVTISTYAPKPPPHHGRRPVMFTNDRGVRALVMPITPSAS